ncbi:tsp-20 [Pristionchus pacificus]|uniref:Tsp-20 n=1 Tax=Pristionchus pacificus TaxID=54126 RepID=A0A2A6D145_PRIPA|nr:tsp-20 [Pristionchus pacificus]|eukprot:PDM84003.1 tsp-20 [Pristionchus pacificus]
MLHQAKRGPPSEVFTFNERPRSLYDNHRDTPSVSTDDFDVGWCQKPFVHYVHCLAVVLKYMCGVLFLFLSCYLYILRSDYVPLLHNQNYMFCVSLMAGAGLLILVNGCLSCSAMNSRCVLCIYTLMLVVILGMQVVLSYTSFNYSRVADSDAEKHLAKDLLQYNNNTVLTRSIDVLQVEGKCCGAIGFEDFRGFEPVTEDEESVEIGNGRRATKQYVPDSCCRSISNGCGKSDHPSNIYYHGCLRFLQRQVKQHIYMIFTLSLAGAILQIRKSGRNKEKRRMVNGRQYHFGVNIEDSAYLE